VRIVALALVILGLTAQMGPDKHLVLCNDTKEWVLFQVIMTTKTQTFCIQPDGSKKIDYYNASVHTVDAHAQKNANCVGPGIGRAYIQTNKQQANAQALIAEFQWRGSGWRMQWLDTNARRLCHQWSS
jgi:hypothetical protein